MKLSIRRTLAINDTKIKYIKILDKIYEVRKLSFFYMSVEAIETDMVIEDVVDSEIWDLSYMKEFKLKLINRKSDAQVINLAEWKSSHIQIVK